MGTPSQGIVLVVGDGVAPSIAPNLAEISKQARSAEGALSSLKNSLASIGGTGVSNLRQLLRDVATGTNQLNTATAKIGIVSGNTANQIGKLSTSYNTLNFAIQATIATLSQYQGSVASARTASQAFTVSTNTATGGLRNVAGGAHGVVSPVIAASSAIRGLEGNFGSSVRAGERFLLTTLKLGPILQAAFPLFGALAFAGILSILAEHIGNVVAAYKALSVQAIQTELDVINAGDKIVKSQKEGFFSAANFARFLHGDNQGAPKSIDVVNISTKLRDLARERAELTAQARDNEAGLQGLAQQKQRVKDLSLELDLVQRQRNEVDKLRQSLSNQASETRKFQVQHFDRESRITTTTTEEVGVLDPSQRKVVEAQLRDAKSAVADLDSEIKILGFDIDAAGKKEPLKAALEQTKEARAQLKAFNIELAAVKDKPGVVSHQDLLSTLESQLKRALPQNKSEIETRIGVEKEAIDRQTQSLDLLAQKYKDQIEQLGLYSDARKIKADQDKIDIAATKLGISLGNDKIKQAKEDVKTAVEGARLQTELNKLYTEVNGPLQTYTAGKAALNKLESDGAISHAKSVQALNILTLEYKRATQPLFDYTQGLQNQTDLLGKYGTALTLAAQLQQVTNDLRNKGINLSSEENNQLTSFLAKLNQQQQIQQQINTIFDANIGQMEKLVTAYAAVSAARQKGIIGQEQERVELTKIKVQLSDLAIELHKATGKDVLTSVFGNYIKDFQGFTKQTSALYKGLFQSIADGAADSFGRAIAFGEDLGAALADVARNALSQLISGFVKLGIQMLITKVIGTTLGATAVSQTIAQALATATAWAPAAALASLATLGANAVPAEAALTATTGLAELLASLSAFSSGGSVSGPGTSTSDSILAKLSNGEFVLQASAVNRIGLSNLEALNRGASVQGLSSSSTNAGVKIFIQHDGSTNVNVQRLSEGEIRVIASQEANRAVEDRAPGVIAGHIANPNSPVSKSLGRNTIATRRR